MIKIKSPSEAELHSMIAEARRTVRDLKEGIRAALLAGAPTGGIRDRLADTRSRISRWDGMLEEAAAQKEKVIADRVAALRFDVGVAVVGAISDRITALQPPPFPTSNQGA